MIRLQRGQFGTYVIENLDADGTVAGDILAQLDWDYPGIASAFGWSPAWVGTLACESCDAPTGAYLSEGGSIPDVAVCLDCYSVAPDPAYLATVRRFACDHSGTDGTIACPECGTLATTFIGAAAEYLDSHIGATADDPGYFAGDAS